MTIKHQQGSSLGSCPIFPSPNIHFKPTFRSLTLCQVLSGGRQRKIKPYIPEGDDVDRLYVPRKRGGKGLVSIQDSVDASIQRLKDYMNKRGGRLVKITRNNTENTSINKTKIIRKQIWEEKQLYGHFKRLTSKISHEKTWTFLRKGNLKRETESLLITAQNNVIRINYVKARIDKTQQNSRCRLCGDRDERINHIISECSKLA